MLMALEISYLDKRLRDICRKEAIAKRLYPESVVNELRARLDDIDAAECLDDLPDIYEVISNSPPGELLIPLTDGYHMRFLQVDLKPGLTDGGFVDWAKVKRIKLMEISTDD